MALDKGGLFNFLIASDIAAGQAKLNRDLKKQQASENKARAFQANLLRWGQSASNNRLMEAAGKNLNTATENAARVADARTMRNVQSRLSLSEQAGAAVASAAYAGIGGSTVDSYNDTIKTKWAIQQELAERGARSEAYLTQQVRESILPDAVAGLSRDVIIADQDFSFKGPTGSGLLGNLATMAVAAGLSVVGAPDAANAVIKARTSGLQGRYGDTAGAAKSFTGALEAFEDEVNNQRDKYRVRGNAAPSSELGIISSTPSFNSSLPVQGLNVITRQGYTSTTLR